MTTKRSFFERLSGNSPIEDSFDSFDDDLPTTTSSSQNTSRSRLGDSPRSTLSSDTDSSTSASGQLPVDVYQTTSDIIIRAFVAGVRADELNISISRDMVEISGARAEREQVSAPDYFTRELFWGSFSRTVLLPQEIDVDSSSASAKDGLLTIILPRLDKAKQTKLRVKVG
jgi:HSP20 family molecular chaperone IbpA